MYIKGGPMRKSILFMKKYVEESSGKRIYLYTFLQTLIVLWPIVNSYFLKMLINCCTSQTILWNTIVKYIILIGLGTTGTIVFTSLSKIIEDVITRKLRYKFDLSIMEVMSTNNMAFIDSSTGRNALDNATDSSYVISQFPFKIIGVITQVFSLIIMLSVIVRFSFWGCCVFLVMMIPGIYLETKGQKDIEGWMRESAPDVRKFSYYRWMLTDRWPAIDVRMYNLTDDITNRYNEEKGIYLEKKKAVNRKGLRASYKATILKNVGMITFIVQVFFYGWTQRIDIGDITLLISYGIASVAALRQIGMLAIYYLYLYREHESIYLDFVNKATVEEQKCNKLTLNTVENIEFDHVWFRYNEESDYVLKGISFQINRGEKATLIGVNGAGKTTIVKLILGFYQVTKGAIRINGRNLEEYDLKDVRKHFSALFQNFVIYPMSLRENIACSHIEEMENDVHINQCLKKAGIDKKQYKLTNDLDTGLSREYDDEAIGLSRGQSQKIALARAYFKDAEFIILDEPSASLDPEAEDMIFQKFDSLAKDRTALMISHRISCTVHCDKILVIKDGIVEENGTHNQLMKNNKFYANLFKMQQMKYISEEGSV
jgi:ABC-type multidrug transport system fused ATPase/permease subunit